MHKAVNNTVTPHCKVNGSWSFTFIFKQAVCSLGEIIQCVEPKGAKKEPLNRAYKWQFPRLPPSKQNPSYHPNITGPKSMQLSLFRVWWQVQWKPAVKQCLTDWSESSYLFSIPPPKNADVTFHFPYRPTSQLTASLTFSTWPPALCWKKMWVINNASFISHSHKMTLHINKE